MHKPSRHALLFIIALFGASIGVARAEPGPSDQEIVMTNKARQLYEEGRAAFEKSKWAEARASFWAAFSLNKHWQIAANLADSELALHRYRDAAEHAAFYLKHAPLNRREKAEKLLEKARAHVASLTVTVDAPGADVLIDGSSIGRSPLEDQVFVEPGAHRIVARLAGRPDSEQAVTLSAGSSRVVALHVAPIERDTSSPALRVGLIAGGATLAGAGLITGVVLAVVAGKHGANADELLAKLPPAGGAAVCQTQAAMCREIDRERGTRDQLSNGAMGVLVGAGALGAATILYATLAPKPKTEARARVMPVAGAGITGVSVTGVW